MTLKSGLMGCSALCLVMTTNTRLLGTILAFSVLTMTGHVQADCEELSFDGHSLARCKVWPAFKDQAIAAKSTFTPVSEDVNDGGMFDLELSIVNSTNDQTLATYCKNEAYPDAVGFEGLIIDTARYKLAPHVRAFGLRSDFGHRSSAMPYSKTDLALYLREVIPCVQCWRGWWLPRTRVSGWATAQVRGRTYAEPSISANRLTTDLQT